MTSPSDFPNIKLDATGRLMRNLFGDSIVQEALDSLILLQGGGVKGRAW